MQIKHKFVEKITLTTINFDETQLE